MLYRRDRLQPSRATPYTLPARFGSGIHPQLAASPFHGIPTTSSVRRRDYWRNIRESVVEKTDLHTITTRSLAQLSDVVRTELSISAELVHDSNVVPVDDGLLMDLTGVDYATAEADSVVDVSSNLITIFVRDEITSVSIPYQVNLYHGADTLLDHLVKRRDRSMVFYLATADGEIMSDRAFFEYDVEAGDEITMCSRMLGGTPQRSKLTGHYRNLNLRYDPLYVDSTAISIASGSRSRDEYTAVPQLFSPHLASSYPRSSDGTHGSIVYAGLEHNDIAMDSSRRKRQGATNVIDSDDKYDESVMEVHKEAQDEGERIDPEQLEWVSDVANELDITPPSITNLSRGNDGVCQAIEFCSPSGELLLAAIKRDISHRDPELSIDLSVFFATLRSAIATRPPLSDEATSTMRRRFDTGYNAISEHCRATGQDDASDTRCYASGSPEFSTGLYGYYAPDYSKGEEMAKAGVKTINMVLHNDITPSNTFMMDLTSLKYPIPGFNSLPEPTKSTPRIKNRAFFDENGVDQGEPIWNLSTEVPKAIMLERAVESTFNVIFGPIVRSEINKELKNKLGLRWKLISFNVSVPVEGVFNSFGVFKGGQAELGIDIVYNRSERLIGSLNIGICHPCYGTISKLHQSNGKFIRCSVQDTAFALLKYFTNGVMPDAGALYARNTFPAKKRKIFGRDIIFARGAERGRETTSGQNIPVGKIDPDVIASAVSKGYLTWEHSVDSNLIAINGKSVLDHICCAAAAAGVETKRNDIVRGLNKLQRAARTATETRKNDVDANGRDSYERVTDNRNNDIDVNGRNSYERMVDNKATTFDENGFSVQHLATAKTAATKFKNAAAAFFDEHHLHLERALWDMTFGDCLKVITAWRNNGFNQLMSTNMRSPSPARFLASGIEILGYEGGSGSFLALRGGLIPIPKQAELYAVITKIALGLITMSRVLKNGERARAIISTDL